jgi:alpha 1,3-glucosidase
MVCVALRSLRYTWLPLWYTLFFESGRNGMPVMRPLWIEFPADPKTFALENQFMVGPGLLVVPVTSPEVTSVNAYFAGEEPWYDVLTAQTHTGGAKVIAAPLRKIPVFQRGGTVLARKMRARRTSSLMRRDPFTFDVALNRVGGAAGTLFVDDYHTFAYRTQERFLYASMVFGKAAEGEYTFKYTVTEGVYTTSEWVERVRVMGFPSPPTAITRADGSAVQFTYDADHATLTIKKPFDGIMLDAQLTISV